MSCHPRVTEWTMTIQAHLPHLGKPQTTVLALWSLGMVLADPWLVRPLAVAVATLWLLSVGGEAEETVLASTVPDVTAMVPQQPRMRRATRLRLVSIFAGAGTSSWWRCSIRHRCPWGALSLNLGRPSPCRRSRLHSCRAWRCPWLPETSGSRSDRAMREGKNMRIMTTLKKTYPRKGGPWEETGEPRESKTKLLDQMRLVLRLKHMSIRTEDTYVHWVRRVILFP